VAGRERARGGGHCCHAGPPGNRGLRSVPQDENDLGSPLLPGRRPAQRLLEVFPRLLRRELVGSTKARVGFDQRRDVDSAYSSLALWFHGSGSSRFWVRPERHREPPFPTDLPLAPSLQPAIPPLPH